MATETNVLKEWEEAYQEASVKWQTFLSTARKCLLAHEGDQWDSAVAGFLRLMRRQAKVFNKIRRTVNLISGYQRKNRLALRIEPIEGSDEDTARQLGGVAQWQMQFENGYNVMSDAFEKGALVTGINLVQLWVDYNNDPVNGDIRFERIPYNHALIDPYFTKPDLSDANYILRRRWMSKDALIALFPDQEKEIRKIEPSGKDNKYLIGALQKRSSDLIYDEFWQIQQRKTKIIVDTQTGQWRDWPGNDEQLKLFRQIYPHVKVFQRYVRYVKASVILENKVVLKEIEKPYGLDEYPFVPVMGFYDPESDDWRRKLQGIVYSMLDPQDEVNRRRSQLLDLVESQINTGWKAEENSVINPKSLYQSGQAVVIWTKEGKLAAVEKLPPAQIPEGFFRLQELFDRDVMEIPGANSELFGMPENENIQVAGFLAKLRQAQGLTVLQPIFDNYRQSKKILGRKLVKIIQENYTPEKVRRIINEEPTQEFYARDFGKYDCVPVEGLLSDTQRQMYFFQMLSLKEMGAPIPWEAILDVAPIEHKKRLKEIVAQQEQAQAQQEQIEKEQQVALNEAIRAKTMSDIEAAKEKAHKAQADSAKAFLDSAKAMKEMEGLEDDRKLKLLKFSADMEERALQMKRRRAMTRR